MLPHVHGVNTMSSSSPNITYPPRSRVPSGAGMALALSGRMFYRSLLAPTPQYLDSVSSPLDPPVNLSLGLGLGAGGAGYCLELVPPTNRGMEGFPEEGSFEGDGFRACGWEEGTQEGAEALLCV